MSHDASHGCKCGKSDEVPTIDALTLPHEIRRAAILGALDALSDGDRMNVIAPHDPKPLLDQIATRFGAEMTHTYLQEGPESWIIQFTKAPAAVSGA